jgi:hypothetical protein
MDLGSQVLGLIASARQLRSRPSQKSSNFNSISPRLRRFLTPNAVYTFIAMLTFYYRCDEITDRGILVLKPDLPTISASSDDRSIVEPELSSAFVGAEEVI